MKSFSKIRIGLYVGEGSGSNGIQNFIKNFKSDKSIIISKVEAKEIINKDLSVFNIIAFTGGSGSKQARSIGIQGRNNIRNFIKSGGNYVGICAGAYLAVSGFDWSLEIVNAETVSKTEWERGKGYVDVELTKEGTKVFKNYSLNFKMRYSNGPILRPILLGKKNTCTVLIKYKSEISQNNVTRGVMLGTPVAIFSKYGLGNVLITGTHPEDTEGLESYLPEVVNFLLSKSRN